jgi:hypothetical protein
LKNENKGLDIALKEVKQQVEKYNGSTSPLGQQVAIL